MAKFSGEIGYVISTKTSPGVYTPQTIYKPCRGEVLSNRRRNQNGSEIFDTLILSNKFSIVENPYIIENHGNIKSIKYLGSEWEVTSIELERPRIILEAGGIYNGQ